MLCSAHDRFRQSMTGFRQSLALVGQSNILTLSFVHRYVQIRDDQDDVVEFCEHMDTVCHTAAQPSIQQRGHNPEAWGKEYKSSIPLWT